MEKATMEHVSRDKLVDDLRLVVSDTEELLKATANQTGDRIAAARIRAEESLRSARARLEEAQAVMMEKTKAAAKATDTYVHDNPWKSVGIAAVAGVLLGVIISRR